jgi:phospholipid/cholesterol/gamma-HCH transport system ATP-binding protein
MASEAAVEFQGVYKAFGNNVLYEDLNLVVHKGEVLTILGGSGSGKSVMLKMMLGLVPADLGSIRVLGEDITGHDDAQSAWMACCWRSSRGRERSTAWSTVRRARR